jgi:hypothetical protein
VHIGQLGGEIAHRAAPDTLALPLVLEQPIEKHVDLLDGISLGIRECRLERALREAVDESIHDGEAELLLAPEVVVKIAFADPAFPQHIVERRAVVAPQINEPGRGVQDLVPCGRTLGTPRLAHRALRLGHMWEPRTCCSMIFTNRLVQKYPIGFAVRQYIGRSEASPRRWLLRQVSPV